MEPILLLAKDAQITGSLQILDKPLAYTIHYWNNTVDRITWNCRFENAGNYRVVINYSIDSHLTGGSMAITAGDQQITAAAAPSGSWYDFKTFDMGSIDIRTTGDIQVSLRALQLPGSADAAMPDIYWILFT